MSTPSKRKGSAFELEIVKAFIAAGWQWAERRLAGNQYDTGDITGIPGVVIECKNQKTLKLAEWVDELVVEMRNARTHIGAVVHKRKGTTDPLDYYVTMRVRDWMALLKEAGY